MVSLVAETKNGKIEGFEADGMYKWFGIPYAKPPVRELRFKRSVPCDNWNGIKQTSIVNKIIALKDAGFLLSDIAKILYNHPSIDSISAMLEDKAETL